MLRIALLELLMLGSVACHSARPSQRDARPGSSSAPAQRLLSPRASSSFACKDDVCRQLYPRLPSSGEWRCAEQGRVVWCAGGEPAAGVVASGGEAGFRCGKRWGKGHGSGERICIDSSPEYPKDSAVARCSFDQEQGIVRVCKSGSDEPKPPLPARVIAACWLDRDCASGRCDRGACSCRADAECETGSCREQYCVEAKP